MITSPVLVGRDEFLELGRRRLTEAASGHGELLLVAGEAGIGKTRFLGALARQARTLGFCVTTAAAFPGDTESSAGLLLDLAGELEATDPDPARHLAERVRGIDDGLTGDRHHRRRTLVRDLTGILQKLPGGPRLLVLEDLHWADDVSLDVLGRLAPRLSARSLLVAGAYRSDELYPTRPMRELRGRLLTQRTAEEIRLPRLTTGQIATLASTVLGAPASHRVVSALHERSDGIPLHVEELLAAPDPAAVPETLAEAVLSRARTLRPATLDIALAAAVIGRSFGFDLLTEVTGETGEQVAVALRELRETYFVLPGADAATFDFRHALIRDALYADTDLPVRRRLHERVAGTGGRHAVVSAHFELAGRPDLAHEHALVAAREATALSSHREALELYRRATRNAPGPLAVGERIAMLAGLGDAAAAVDENVEAAAAYDQAYELARDAGKVCAAAGLVPRMVAVGHLLGDPLTERVGRLRAAVRMLDDAGLEAGTERAGLCSATAAAYMLDRRLDEAIEEGRCSSVRRADDDSSLNTTATLGSVLVFAGQPDEGWSLLEQAVGRARADRREAEAARAHRMLASTASVVVEYDLADRCLAEGITYAETVELWNHRHYLAAHLGHVRWATGDWDAAATIAGQALADGRGGITTRITAQYVLGYLALGRGDWPAAERLLGEALEAGRGMAELQRYSPPLWGLAEMARCRGAFDRAVDLCEEGYRASAEVSDAAYLFPFLITGVRAYLGRDDVAAAEDFAGRVGAVLRSRSIPGTLPALGHAEGLLRAAQGSLDDAFLLLEDALADWVGRRRLWESGWVRVDLAGLALRRRRRAEAARWLDEVRALDVVVLRQAADALAASSGSAGSSVRYPLTAREFEVARLVADGLTNRQIAERLVLAPKTISAHVEHILTKLGAARRAEIAVWTTERR